MHRVAWDLRYPDPPTLNYGYNGTLLDYREYTLSWHAMPGQTPRSTLVGPMVLPGTYTAKLTVDGRSYTQPITVVAGSARRGSAARRSPRSSSCSSGWSPASRRRTTRVNYVQELRAALDGPDEGIGGEPVRPRRLRRAAQTLDAAAGAARQRTCGFRHRASRPRTAAQRSARRRHGADGQRDRRRRWAVPQHRHSLDDVAASADVDHRRAEREPPARRTRPAAGLDGAECSGVRSRPLKLVPKVATVQGCLTVRGYQVPGVPSAARERRARGLLQLLKWHRPSTTARRARRRVEQQSLDVDFSTEEE